VHQVGFSLNKYVSNYLIVYLPFHIIHNFNILNIIILGIVLPRIHVLVLILPYIWDSLQMARRRRNM